MPWAEYWGVNPELLESTSPDDVLSTPCICVNQDVGEGRRPAGAAAQASREEFIPTLRRDRDGKADLGAPAAEDLGGHLD